MLTRLLENDVREEFAVKIEHAIDVYAMFFDRLSEASTEIVGSSRKEVARTNGLQSVGKELLSLLEHIGNELVFESETYTVDEYTLRIVDEYLDQIDYSLRLFMDNENAIYWVEENNWQLTLVIMPQAVKDVLKERVFAKKIPYIFTSATLSDNQSFDYLAYSLGIAKPLSFSVESPFDYDEQMQIAVKNVSDDQEEAFAEKSPLLLLSSKKRTDEHFYCLTAKKN